MSEQDEINVIQTILTAFEGHKNEVLEALDRNARYYDRRMRLVERGLGRVESSQRQLINTANHRMTDLQKAIVAVDDKVSGKVGKGELFTHLISDAIHNTWFWAGIGAIALALGPTIVANWTNFLRVFGHA